MHRVIVRSGPVGIAASGKNYVPAFVRILTIVASDSICVQRIIRTVAYKWEEVGLERLFLVWHTQASSANAGRAMGFVP